MAWEMEDGVGRAESAEMYHRAGSGYRRLTEPGKHEPAPYGTTPHYKARNPGLSSCHPSICTCGFCLHQTFFHPSVVEPVNHPAWDYARQGRMEESISTKPKPLQGICGNNDKRWTAEGTGKAYTKRRFREAHNKVVGKTQG